MKPEDCIRLSRRWDRTKLRKIVRDLKGGKTVGKWDQGKALEYAVLRAFELDRLEITYPFSVSVGNAPAAEQLDGAVTTAAARFLIETKSGLSSSLDFTPIAKLHNQLSRRPPATMGLVFALKGFSIAAIDLARMAGPRVLLWTPNDLDLGLSRNGRMKRVLEVKYARAEEHGLPDYFPRREDL